MEEKIKLALIQPSSPPDKEKVERALKALQKLALPFKSFITFEDDPPSQKAFLLYEVLTSSQFSHLWAIRGGAGALKLLPYLEELFNQSSLCPKNLPSLIGFSDVTTLLLYFWKRFKLKGIHGPMLINLPDLKGDCLKVLVAIIKKERQEVLLRGRAFQKGKGEGILIGGNLMTLVSLCGTPYFSIHEEVILFLEETSEKLYKIERAFLQLLWNFSSSKIKGLILGDLGEVNPEEFLLSIKEFLPEGLPVGYFFSFGHRDNNFPLVVGARAHLEVREKEATLIFYP